MNGLKLNACPPAPTAPAISAMHTTKETYLSTDMFFLKVQRAFMIKLNVTANKKATRFAFPCPQHKLNVKKMKMLQWITVLTNPVKIYFWKSFSADTNFNKFIALIFSYGDY
jgi:hypothetical protein